MEKPDYLYEESDIEVIDESLPEDDLGIEKHPYHVLSNKKKTP